MKLLCQIALERSIPDVSDVVTRTIVADFGSSFAQLCLCHQGTDLPALPLLLAPAPSFDLLHHLVEVMQEERHIPCLLGQDQSVLPFCYAKMMHKPIESAVRNRIALNIA